MKNDLRFAVSVGAAAGAVEAALRSSGAHGWGAGQLSAFVVLSVALSAGLGAALALLAARFRSPQVRRAAVMSGLVGLFAAVSYRYEFVLNDFVRSPKVWAGVPAVFLLGAAAGGVAGRWLTARGLVAVTVISVGIAGVRAWPRSGPIAGSERPNVLVISMDTTRADHVVGKPTWDRLAREGTTFTQAIAAAPITEPSHLAMFTGVAPFRSGVVSNGTNLGERPLVWKDFSAAGYVTAGFVAGFPMHSKYGWDQGMSVWDDDFGLWPGAESLTLVKAWNQVALKEHALRERTADRVVSRAATWLGAHRDEQFFAFVHFYDAHGPYVSPHNAAIGPAPTVGEPLALPAYWPAPARAITSESWLKQAYDAEVMTVDEAVGQVLAALGDRLDHTVVVVTADHGESLGEHGVLFDHGDDLYDPSLRVPLVVRWPGHVRAGVSLDCQVGGVDLAPTLRGLAGVAEPAGLEMDGISRAQELTSGGCRPVSVVSSTTAGRFVERPPVDHALRNEGSKLILKEAGDVLEYDLVADPGELHNLAPITEPTNVVAAFRLLLGRGTAGLSPTLDAETRKALELLGYIDPEVAP